MSDHTEHSELTPVDLAYWQERAEMATALRKELAETPLPLGDVADRVRALELALWTAFGYARMLDEEGKE